MNQFAYDAIEEAWMLTVKARALCPYPGQKAIGMVGYDSPPWYQKRGAVYFVNLARPLTEKDATELEEIGKFVNRSFIVSMAAILEAYNVVPYRKNPNRSVDGGDHAQLVKCLRNRFAHGEWEYDDRDPKHIDTWQLLERLFPDVAAKGPGFIVEIDRVLEPLKNGVLDYIRATT